jgi:cyclophilin family peptidyl-prolyl cis-trans isomerase
MSRIISTFAALALMVGLSAQAPDLDPDNTLYLDLKDGRVVIEVWPDLTVHNVDRVIQLAREGFYDGLVFHKVIEGFIAVTGDPTGTGMYHSHLGNVPDEFSASSFLRGTIGAVNSGAPHSANSQFFILLEDYPSFDNRYTAWGRVVSGMEFVDNIKIGVGRSGVVRNPDKIVRLQVAADAAE